MRVDIAGHAVIEATAMSSTLRVTTVGDADDPLIAHQVQDALEVFDAFAAQCSRFDPTSDLSAANRQPDSWHVVGGYCTAAIQAAWEAYAATDGRFDPRILTDLLALGYDRWPPEPRAERPALRRPFALWRPAVDPTLGRIHLGGSPIDLGGIGKGLAVRWAARALSGVPHLIEAGGDCVCHGPSPDGSRWRVGVQDPLGDDWPVAVLALADQACATASVLRRQWEVGGTRVHHLIDPSTGAPGGAGLLSVSVVADDPAWAEVWSKVLFLTGADQIARAAAQMRIAACWVSEDGRLGCSDHLADAMVWRRP